MDLHPPPPASESDSSDSENEMGGSGALSSAREEEVSTMFVPNRTEMRERAAEEGVVRTISGIRPKRMSSYATPVGKYRPPGLLSQVSGCVAGGGYHSLMIDEEGFVYGCGSNRRGQIGINSTATRIFEPARVEGLPYEVEEEGGGKRRNHCVMVAAGTLHSAAVMDNGALYTWGAIEAGLGQLGHKEYRLKGKTGECLIPRPVTFGHFAVGVKIKSVALGSTHSLAVTEAGAVLAWGSTTHGKLGLQEEEKEGDSFSGERKMDISVTFTSSLWVEYPMQVMLPLRATHVGAGEKHSAAILSDGSLYTWGKGSCLGVGKVVDDSPYPVHVKQWFGPDYEDAKQPALSQVSCGSEHTAAISRDGQVWTFGDGLHGQLGHWTKHSEPFPRMIDVNNSGLCFKSVVCGAWHTVFVTFAGDIMTCGAGRNRRRGSERAHMRLGTVDDSEEDRLRPLIVKGPFRLRTSNNVEHIGAGAYHTMAVNGKGELITFGDGIEGQLGLGPEAPTETRFSRRPISPTLGDEAEAPPPTPPSQDDGKVGVSTGVPHVVHSLADRYLYIKLETYIHED